MEQDLFSQVAKPFDPRPYQQAAFDKCLDFFNNETKSKYDSGVFVGPTAWGKSLLVGYLGSKIKGNTIVIQPNAELLIQNYKKFRSYNGQGTIYSASAGVKEMSNMMFVTPGSIIKQLPMLKRIGFDNLIIDECDFNTKSSKGSQFWKIFTELQPKKVLGLTATPVKLKQMQGDNGRPSPYLRMLNRLREGGGFTWKKIIHVTQIQELQDYWANIEYNEYLFDESRLVLNSAGTDYTDKSIEIAVKHNKVIDNMAEDLKNMIASGSRKHIMVYLPDVDTANEFQKKFPGQCYAVTAKTDRARRDRIVNAFKQGKFPVLANVKIFTVGFDFPDLDCIMLGYPTNSWRLYYQTIGRIVRVNENCSCGSGIPHKKCCGDGLVVDYCGMTKKFGKVQGVTLEDIPGYGWAIFNEHNEILTGSSFPINDTPRKTRDWVAFHYGKLHAEKNKPFVGKYEYMHKGKFEGEHISRLPVWYLEYAAEWKAKNPTDKAMRSALAEELHKRRL